MLSPAGRRDVVCRATPIAWVKSSKRGNSIIAPGQFEIGGYYGFAVKGLSGTLYLCNVVLFVVRMAWWYIRVDSGESSLENRVPRELLERLRISKGSSGVTGGEMNCHS
jgi:hypothetical protein